MLSGLWVPAGDGGGSGGVSGVASRPGAQPCGKMIAAATGGVGVLPSRPHTLAPPRKPPAR